MQVCAIQRVYCHTAIALDIHCRNVVGSNGESTDDEGLLMQQARLAVAPILNSEGKLLRGEIVNG